MIAHNKRNESSHGLWRFTALDYHLLGEQALFVVDMD